MAGWVRECDYQHEIALLEDTIFTLRKERNRLGLRVQDLEAEVAELNAENELLAEEFLMITTTTERQS